ncbi:arsenate reductase ArsC [Azospirillum picis]|uniref:Protein-tyrosine-phosphatase n=1 Tax=Azospirillum picis TaxID=488438 RepID=A0ABU0MMX2_9PROT|nr:arsenate reductase ArsC [Azospirillum picis]MBP2300630.1 protein-tyrosine-phosphatase [Azospirillum picis]MDQ0534599.1 protein-tyrosine-phosphatase [Azospirillum picis]
MTTQSGSEKTYTVLFLCTHNSARSIMAECLMRRWGAGRFTAYSAGSHPAGTINPHTLATLRAFNLPTDSLRSKSWDEFAGPQAPALDFVFTVCDQAAGELCPAWNGRPLTAHWGVEDPAAATGPEDRVRMAFRRTYVELESRIKIFGSLRVEQLDRLTLQSSLHAIGSVHGLPEGELADA